MNLYFATCERGRALRFLQDLYPTANIEDSGTTKQLLDFVERDVVRIPDPAMHGKRVAIIPGNNWDGKLREDVVSVCSAFHEYAQANPSGIQTVKP